MEEETEVDEANSTESENEWVSVAKTKGYKKSKAVVETARLVCYCSLMKSLSLLIKS